MFGLSLEETLAQQENLEALAAEYAPKEDEIFPGNLFYGIDQIIKAYAGFPADYALKVVIPHGIALADDKVWFKELFNPLPSIFYYPDAAKDRYLKNLNDNHIRKSLTPIASPFVYLQKLYQDIPKPTRKGTLFFLSHSSHYITAETDFEAVAQMLLALPEAYHPVTVCIYWRDYQLGRHHLFAQLGFKIVCAGHMFDPLFLPRLYHLCSLYQYACSNEIGSHLFYTVRSGCSYFQLDIAPSTYTSNDPNRLVWDFSDGQTPILQTLRELFKEPQPEASLQQKELVDHYLSVHHVRSPADLKEQLLESERWYRLSKEPSQYFSITSTSLQDDLDTIPSSLSSAGRRFLYNFLAQEWSGKNSVLQIGDTWGASTRAIATGMLHNPQRQSQSTLQVSAPFDVKITEQDTATLHAILDQPLAQIHSQLEAFKLLHAVQDYWPLIQAHSSPQTPDHLTQEIPINLPEDESAHGIYDIIYVAEGQSWEMIRAWLRQLAANLQEGSLWFFESYNNPHFFWIPLSFYYLSHCWQPITSVEGLAGFRLLQPITSAEIEAHLLPHLPLAEPGKCFVDRGFTALTLHAQNTANAEALFYFSLQHSAALAYLGYLDEAQAKVIALLTQPWAKRWEAIALSLLDCITYDAQHSPIPLFTPQQQQQLTITTRNLIPPAQNAKALQKKLNALQSRHTALTQELEALKRSKIWRFYQLLQKFKPSLK